MPLATGGQDWRRYVGACFPADYGDARDRFRRLCAKNGASWKAYRNPEIGAKGEELTTDVAWFGPADASRVMVLVSSTHGVEGFCGTGAQLDWMGSGGPPALPDDTAALIVHAINPYGYSWQRRGTEGNVDLNRNGLDFADGPLDNPRFLELSDAFSPRELDGPVADAALAKRERFIEQYGLAEYRRVRTMGQHVDPQGIHYGGEGPTWSRITIERIVEDFGLSAKGQVAIIDYHTGLGPFGYGEPICGCRPEEPGRDRAAAWYGDSLTEPLRGTSTSAVIPGLTQHIWAREIGIERITFIALEYGTYPSGEVENAMRDENWLYRYGNPSGLDDVTRGIKQRFIRAFYPGTLDWQELVLWRSRQIIRQTLNGLSSWPKLGGA